MYRLAWKFLAPSLLLLAIVWPNNAQALSGSQFQAGNIISDSLFYDGTSMSSSQIQNFLEAKVPDCDSGYTCLKSYEQKTPNKTASEFCNAYNDGTGYKKASRIIYEVGKACGISQKALLVLIQKEQSLVLDTSPSSRQYKYAAGYGCPDSTGCSGYEGLFNQVYKAAWQFKRYKINSDDYNYKAGRKSYVQWHPNTSCGGSYVTMQSHATAGLYNYTPYRPNGAALNNLFGEGNSCSSYGNRNFWVFYNIWFGNPIKPENYRLIECSGVKYMVEKWRHMKRQLTSNALREFNFDDFRFSVEDPACEYPTYSVALDTIARSRNTGNVYMLNAEKYFLLQSSSITNAWGYEGDYDDKSSVPQLDGETLNNFQIVSSTARLAKSANTGKVYLLDEGKIYRISGTPSNTNTLKLIQGDNAIPMGTFSGEHLSYLKTTNGEGLPIRASFRISDGSWYLFDSGKVRKVSQQYYPNRWDESGIFDGPTLSVDVAKSMNPTKGIGKGFKWSNKTYYIVSEGGSLLTTKNFSTAYRWGVTKDPRISTLLRVEIQNTN